MGCRFIGRKTTRRAASMPLFKRGRRGPLSIPDADHVGRGQRQSDEDLIAWFRGGGRAHC
jgi:hypothetical protein